MGSRRFRVKERLQCFFLPNVDPHLDLIGLMLSILLEEYPTHPLYDIYMI
jgi:hypothetical protein